MACATLPVTEQNRFACSQADGYPLLVGEASEVGPFHRIYDDACDIGLVVRTDKGNLVTFYVSKEERDAEGDLTSWLLLPTSESIRKVPACAPARIIVFND